MMALVVAREQLIHTETSHVNKSSHYLDSTSLVPFLSLYPFPSLSLCPLHPSSLQLLPSLLPPLSNSSPPSSLQLLPSLLPPTPPLTLRLLMETMLTGMEWPDSCRMKEKLVMSHKMHVPSCHHDNNQTNITSGLKVPPTGEITHVHTSHEKKCIQIKLKFLTTT